MKTPALPMTGQCLCGAVRYEVRGRPFLIAACHCTDCQKRTSSAFSMNMPVRKEDFALTAGDVLDVVRTAPSGSTTIHGYCGTCHSRIYSKPSAMPNQVSVRPGTLDDTGWVEPTVHIYTRSAMPGAVPSGATAFETDPPDWMPFVTAFAARWTEGAS